MFFAIRIDGLICDVQTRRQQNDVIQSLWKAHVATEYHFQYSHSSFACRRLKAEIEQNDYFEWFIKFARRMTQRRRRTKNAMTFRMKWYDSWQRRNGSKHFLNHKSSINWMMWNKESNQRLFFDELRILFHIFSLSFSSIFSSPNQMHTQIAFCTCVDFSVNKDAHEHARYPTRLCECSEMHTCASHNAHCIHCGRNHWTTRIAVFV